MQLTVLGRLTAGGEELDLGPRDRVVLQMLLLRRGSATTAEQLADALWPDTPPASWRKVVQGCVVRLRRLLGSGAIQTTPAGYRLEVPGEDVDAVRFERLVGRGRELLALGDAERAAHTIAEAHALWQGRPYTELADRDDAVIESERLMELRREAEELAIEAALRAGRHREVLADAHAATAREPLREQRWAMLARAEYQSGRQTQALQTLQRARTVLVTEAGLDPGPELVELEAAILRQDTSLTVDEAEVQAASTGRLITSSGSGAFLLRDPFTLEAVSPVFPASAPPTSYHFSETGILSSSGGSGTELWDVASAQPLSGVLPAFRSALSPDGLTLYLGAGPVGDVVRSLSLDPRTLAEEACRRAGRNLVPTPWCLRRRP